MKLASEALLKVIERTGCLDLKRIAAEPGCKAAYRVVCYYGDASARHSVATLRVPSHGDNVLSVVYEGLFEHRPLTYVINRLNVEKIQQALMNTRFDHLKDQTDFDVKSIRLWLVERAAGSYRKSVLIVPDEPVMPYSQIVNAIDDLLPEATKKVQ